MIIQIFNVLLGMLFLATTVVIIKTLKEGIYRPAVIVGFFELVLIGFLVWVLNQSTYIR